MAWLAMAVAANASDVAVATSRTGNPREIGLDMVLPFSTGMGTGSWVAGQDPAAHRPDPIAGPQGSQVRNQPVHNCQIAPATRSGPRRNAVVFQGKSKNSATGLRYPDGPGPLEGAWSLRDHARSGN